jgi:glycine cleavage system H protein
MTGLREEQQLKYTQEHLWVSIEGDTARFGISDHAQKELEDIVFVDLPEVGRRFEKGDIVCTVESVKSTNDLSSPLTGVVLGVNSGVSDHPEVVNKDPYGEGWLLTFRVERPEEADALLDWAAYQALIA